MEGKGFISLPFLGDNMPTIKDFKELYITILIGIIFVGLTLISTVQGIEEKAIECIYCHQKLSILFEDEDTQCTGCHVVITNPSEHNNNICNNCHTIINQTTFHTTHKPVVCSTCHGLNGEGKPVQAFTDCTGCHTSQVHDIHTNCVTCHGTSVQGKQVPIKTLVNQTDYSKYTLYSILQSIYQSLIGGIND